MKHLFELYYNKVVNGDDEIRMFEQFFNKERPQLEKWLNKFLKNRQSKNDEKANKIKNEGNEYYRKKSFNEALTFYTKALRHAEYNKENYGLIISNRSAVFYMMENYENCLKDLKHCLNTNCCETTKLKAQIRTIKCLSKMNLQEELRKQLKESFQFLQESTQILNKDQIKCDILESTKEGPSKIFINSLSVNKNVDVKIKNSFNEHFLDASSAIRLDYNEERGRHVVATEQLEEGDVLFVEKAFAFAPIFINDEMELSPNKCYHCLEDTYTSIPCKYCVQCIFCDESCRDNDWEEFHQFECVGMQTGLWYHTGIAFPALRALIKGKPSKFSNLTNSFEADVANYGNKGDNYCYFNKLVSNISKMDNVVPILITASIVILYLEKVTNFFELTDEPFLKLGGLLTRHIAQFQCNSSLIKHQVGAFEDDNSVDIACGIYPSVSMMNHSCKPNINICYYRDTVIVKAAQKILVNEEIFNCYGIDWRYEDWDTRQEKCQSIYFFKCKCCVCKSLNKK